MSCETNEHDLGDLVRTSAMFTDALTSVAIDPTVVHLSLRAPDGTITTLTYVTDAAVVRTATGAYYSDVNANQAGLWFYRWWSTGTGQAAVEQQFQVRTAEAI